MEKHRARKASSPTSQTPSQKPHTSPKPPRPPLPSPPRIRPLSPSPPRIRPPSPSPPRKWSQPPSPPRKWPQLPLPPRKWPQPSSPPRQWPQPPSQPTSPPQLQLQPQPLPQPQPQPPPQSQPQLQPPKPWSQLLPQPQPPEPWPQPQPPQPWSQPPQPWPQTQPQPPQPWPQTQSQPQPQPPQPWPQPQPLQPWPQPQPLQPWPQPQPLQPWPQPQPLQPWPQPQPLQPWPQPQSQPQPQPWTQPQPHPNVKSITQLLNVAPDCRILQIVDAYKDEPENPKYAFKHLLFCVTEPQFRQKIAGVPEMMWEEAMEKLKGMKSADGERLWFQLVQGFKDLTLRLKIQDEVIVSDAERLGITQSNIKTLQRYVQVDILTWIQRMKQKEQILLLRLLRVMRIVEALEGKGNRIPLITGEAELAQKLVTITRRLKGPGADLCRKVQNLLTTCRIRTNSRAYARSVYLPVSTKIHEHSLADLHKILQQQTDAIARLGSVLKRDICHMDIMMAEVRDT